MFYENTFAPNVTILGMHCLRVDFYNNFFTFLARKCFLPLTTCENVFANDAYFCLIDTRKTRTAVLEKFAVNDQSN